MPEADIGEQGTGDAVIYVCKNKKGKEIYTFRYMSPSWHLYDSQSHAFAPAPSTRYSGGADAGARRLNRYAWAVTAPDARAGDTHSLLLWCSLRSKLSLAYP